MKEVQNQYIYALLTFCVYSVAYAFVINVHGILEYAMGSPYAFSFYRLWPPYKYPLDYIWPYLFGAFASAYCLIRGRQSYWLILLAAPAYFIAAPSFLASWGLSYDNEGEATAFTIIFGTPFLFLATIIAWYICRKFWKNPR